MPVSAYEGIVGVIGAGSFGSSIAHLLSFNVDVLIYTRRQEVVDTINQTHHHYGIDLSPRIKATIDFQHVTETCKLIFVIVPSAKFRSVMRKLGPFLRPHHILIHGTKGLDMDGVDEKQIEEKGLTRKNVHTMTEVIRQESSVLRVACLSGPNLAKEILDGQPTATVIGSMFDEVISIGKKVLGSRHFHVFGTYDVLGAELAGVLKNIIALGSGVLRGKGYGKNLQALLITRGLMEMIYFGKAMGADSRAFLGTAGIGDLVATATSPDSRNFTFGYRLGKGESFEHITKTMPELAEGVRTLKIARYLAKYYQMRIPITNALYNIIYENYKIEQAIDHLMSLPAVVDFDFNFKKY